MRFLIMTINGTASSVGMLAFIAFVLFTLYNIGYSKQAFIVFCVCTVITFFTPNKSEIDSYWLKTSNEVEQLRNEIEDLQAEIVELHK